MTEGTRASFLTLKVKDAIDKIEENRYLLPAIQREEDLVKAEQCAKRAIELDPKYVGGWDNLGHVLLKRGDYVEAEKAFKKAIDLVPNSREAHYHLGILYSETDRKSEALDEFRNIISLDPTNGGAWNNLGWLLENDGHLSEAEVAYRNAIDYSPDIHQSWYNLAKILTTQGRLDEFQLLIEKASQHDPQLLLTILQLARDLEVEENTASPIDPDVLEEIVKYCLFTQDDLQFLSSDWNEMAELHSKRLWSKAGGKLLKKKILDGNFGKCSECGAYLLPFGRRNKPYIANLLFFCLCCNKVRGEAKFADGSLYGSWFDLDKETPEWISELKDECG